VSTAFLPALKLLAIALCFSVFTVTAYPVEPDFQSLWSEADNLRKEAASQGHEWRDTAKVLLEAKKEYKAGNHEKGLMLLSKGRAESIAALTQAAREKKQWNHRVVK
jgi:hypothetical protein